VSISIAPPLNKLTGKPAWLRVRAVPIQIGRSEDRQLINEHVLAALCIDEPTRNQSRMRVINPLDNVDADGKHRVPTICSFLALALMMPPNVLRVSCAAPIDRDGNRAKISFQNAHDLGAA